MRRLRLPALAFVFAALLAPARAQAPPPSPAVVDAREARRTAILELAARYVRHEWRATEKNVLHGSAPDGIRIDTPDASHSPGGWKADGSTNVGIPYQWGGFSTPEQFDAGIAAGMAAGHIPKSGAAAASAHAVGVDCSGFLSRCWDLPIKQSTRSLPLFCYPLDRFEALLPADAINSPDGHVVLFKEFADEEKTRVRVIEAAIPVVRESEYAVDFLRSKNYTPLRYKPLDPRWATLDLGPPTFTAKPGEGSRGRWIPAGGRRPATTTPTASPLADAKPGEWARYRLVTSRLPGRELQVTRAVVGADGDGVEVRSIALFDAKPLEMSTTYATDRTGIDALVDFRQFLEPVHDLEVLEIQGTRGGFELGGRTFPAIKTEAKLRGALVIRGQRYPLDLAVEAIQSDRVPVHHVLEARYDVRVEFGSRPARESVRFELVECRVPRQ